MGNSLKKLFKKIIKRQKWKTENLSWLFLKKAEGLFIPIRISKNNFAKATMVELKLASNVRTDEKGNIIMETKRKKTPSYIA